MAPDSGSDTDSDSTASEFVSNSRAPDHSVGSASPGESIGRRIRVLYVHNSADIYGASRSLLRLLSVLRESPMIQPFVVLPEEGPLSRRIRDLRVSVTVDPSLSIITRSALRPGRLIPLIAGFPGGAIRMARFIRRTRIDLVHTNTGVIFSPALAARLARVPHVWHIRDSFLEFRQAWPAYAAYMRSLSDRIIAVSNPIAAQFRSGSGVTVVHNGVSMDEFDGDWGRPAAEFRAKHDLGAAFVVGCVGRIKFVRKGQEILIRAASILRQRGVSARYVIVGSPSPGSEDHLDQLKALIADLDLGDSVVLTGEMDDVRPAYAAMDVLVLPSCQPEPFGGVVLEAMAMERPVIATAIGGSLDQVADGETGFLVRPGDPEALADPLERLAHDAPLRAAMGKAGRDRLATRFAFDQMLARFVGVYRECLDERRAPLR